ncbi:MAG: hypothetical protein EOM23_05800, partial [Candidatus Moranbacteria bacterium]|nr:hypothetical protein [Candidatus Moranbacteria bacterium]
MEEITYLNSKSGQFSCRIYPEEMELINKNIEILTGAKRTMSFREFLLAMINRMIQNNHVPNTNLETLMKENDGLRKTIDDYLKGIESLKHEKRELYEKNASLFSENESLRAELS